MGALTILLQDGIGGLYVKVEEGIKDVGKKGEWMEISPIDGALVINVGDALLSAEHRVRTTSDKSRVSIPVFTMPKPTEKIGPLPRLGSHGPCWPLPWSTASATGDGARFWELAFQDYVSNFFSNAHDGKKSLPFAQFILKSPRDKNKVGSINLKLGVLRLQPWVPDFNPSLQKSTNAQVWVRFYDFSWEYWHPKTIFDLARGIGVPLRLKKATIDGGCFLRISEKCLS
ncbi:hypothetical protein Ddye_013162 [Dipteronia dyeriana]|uniref:Fe2OG dioxygenase domain-containing protein n=1 Tax=Dipteronia dyeriana TaxID=168575 RepID=A0AAE0CJD5_9ROSI|nr:hypothetical protein Ddye_013162 [Dipteronia dyeriana]